MGLGCGLEYCASWAIATEAGVPGRSTLAQAIALTPGVVSARTSSSTTSARPGLVMLSSRAAVGRYIVSGRVVALPSRPVRVCVPEDIPAVERPGDAPIVDCTLGVTAAS